jgi:hypothetical protein
MKALSIKEPWAGLIIEGKKTIELRTWRTRYRGPLLIHRSGKNGGVVGAAEIVDIIEIGSPEQFRSLRERHRAPEAFYAEKLFGWVLAKARPVKFIPCKGRLGLWEPSADILAEIETSP